MKIKTAVAIIGSSEAMGDAIAKTLAKDDFRLLLFGEDSDKIATLISQIYEISPAADVEKMPGSIDACWEADVIILSLPYVAEKALLDAILPFVRQKIVVSFSQKNLDATADLTELEEMQLYLPDTYVVKGYNAAFSGEAPEVYISSFYNSALNTVEKLITAAGFQPILILHDVQRHNA